MTAPAAPALLMPGYRVDPDTGAWTTLPWPGDPALPYSDPSRLAELPPSLGPHIIVWAHRNLVEPNSGKPWRFTPGQARFVHLWYAIDPDTGRWLYRTGVKRGAKGPIAHDTPVMTPDGWTTHGELRPGSKVFAVDGTVTTVTDIRDEVLEDCYRITFRDGSTIICTGGHRWPMDVFNGSRRVRRIVTVRDMLSEGLVYERPASASSKSTTGDVKRFCVLPSPCIDGDPVDSSLDPWLLGYWLGNGDSDCARLTCDMDDLEYVTEQISEAGFAPGGAQNTHGRAWRVSFLGGAKHLREIGVLNAKRIPANLLRASREQRWALLQGIVDADGHVGSTGAVEICLSDLALAADVHELAVSLGLAPTSTIRATKCFGKRYGDALRIRFTPQQGEPAARMPRKKARLRGAGERSHRRPFSRSRTVVSIEKVDTVPARCLTVDHPEHQYLVGEQNVPTCNTGKDPFAAALAIIEFCGPVQFDRIVDGMMLGRRRRMSLVQLAANSLNQASKLMRMVNSMFSADLVHSLNIDVGQTRTVMPGGCRIELLTASEKSMEGDPPTAVFLNESHHMTAASGGEKTADTARRNAGKSPASIQARVLELTNAHSPGMDSVAEKSFDEWQIQQMRPESLRDMLYDSTEADPTTNPGDPVSMRHGIEQAYMDAPWADIDRLLSEALDSRTSPAETIRFYLNGLAAAEDAWVDPRAFDDCAQPDITVEEGEKIAMFLDCSKSGDATTLSACRLSDGHVLSLGGWRKPHGERGKGWIAPREVVDAVVREAFDFYDVVWFGVDPSPATDDDTEALYWKPMIDQWHRDFQKHLKVWATPGAGGHSVLFDMRLSTSGAVKRNKLFTEAAMQTVLDVEEEHTLTHDGAPMLRNHVHNARRRPNQWGIGLGKINRSSNDLVDYAVTMVGARMGRQLALLNPKVKTGRNRGARRVRLQ